MSSPAAILHLIARLDGYGRARMLRHLATRQAELGANVTVGALAADSLIAGELRAAGVDVRSLHSRGPWDVVAQARLVRLAAGASVELVHAWDARTLALATLARRRRLAPPCVATLSWIDANRSWSARVVKQARRRVARFAAADEPTGAWLTQQGIEGDRLQAIPPGTVTTKATRSRADVLSELALPPDAPLIAVAGALARSKRLDETIWAFELVRVLHPHARLLIAGDGPDRPRLERFARQVSQPDCVRFLGYRNDWTELLPHVDVFWQLNASPTTSCALLEALAAGVPVVAAEASAHRAVVVPDETGLLVPHGDRAEITRATDQLLGDPESARRMGRAAATSGALQFPLAKALQSYELLYGGVLVHADAVGG